MVGPPDDSTGDPRRRGKPFPDWTAPRGPGDPVAMADDVFPPRPDGAPTGSQFFELAVNLALPDREALIFQQIGAGNVPDFVRRRHAVTMTGGGRQISLQVLADY